MAELLIGCGRRLEKQMVWNGSRDWNGRVTLDINPDNKPDVVHDLTKFPLPFEDNTFDEIHAYEVLEHTGQQGDWRFFFEQFSEFYRILKPNGVIMGTSPHWSSPWAWMDPGHTRAMGPEMMVFLSQKNYTEQVGKTPMTDYRFVYKADFDLVESTVMENKQYGYGLQAIKPSRIEV